MLYQILNAVSKKPLSCFVNANADTENKLSEKSINEFLNVRDEIVKKEDTKEIVVTISNDLINEKFEKLTFLDGYKLYYGPNEFNVTTNECRILESIPSLYFPLITAYYAIKAAPKISNEFKNQNKATAWPSAYIAKRKHLDYLIYKSIIAGVKKGFPITVFTFGLVYFPSLYQLYVKKSVGWVYGVTGALMGSVYLFYRGPVAMLTGGFLMGIPSMLYGYIFLLIQKTNNYTMDQVLRSRIKDDLVHKE